MNIHLGQKQIQWLLHPIAWICWAESLGRQKVYNFLQTVTLVILLQVNCLWIKRPPNESEYLQFFIRIYQESDFFQPRDTALSLQLTLFIMLYKITLWSYNYFYIHYFRACRISPLLLNNEWPVLNYTRVLKGETIHTWRSIEKLWFSAWLKISLWFSYKKVNQSELKWKRIHIEMQKEIIIFSE